MPKLKGFISYAHTDEDYFKLIKEGLRKHGKHSSLIDSDLWSDEKILTGLPWHESIQEQIKDCDFTVFLVSSNFLASEYIIEHEFKNFLKRQDEEGFLFFPLLVNACDFSFWERLAARQFFIPNGKDYGRPEITEYLTFGDLVSYNFRTGEIFPNPDRERYMMNSLKKIEAALLEYQKNNAVKKSLPTSKYFYIKHVSEIQPKDFLETRSLPSQGFRSYYLDRPYLDGRLTANYLKHRHTIISGKPLAGKTRSVYELVNGLKGKDVVLFFPELKNFESGDFRIPETKSEIIVFFDDIERFLLLENLDLALRVLMLQENIWVVATCRKDRLQEVKNTLDDELSNFDMLEVQMLNAKEDTALRRDMPDRPNPKSDGTPGGYCLMVGAMHKFYNSFAAESLEHEIFHACKALKLCGKMGFDASFQKEKIKEYCLKRLEYYYGVSRSIPLAEWERAFQNLIRKDLIVYSDEMIAVEEIYLDEFVIVKEAELKREILNYFPTVEIYNYFIGKSNDYISATRLFEQMLLLDIFPDKFTFNNLMQKCNTFQEGFKLIMAEIKDYNVNPKTGTFNILISLCNSLEEGYEVLKIMEEVNDESNIWTFIPLLRLCTKEEEKVAIWGKISTVRISDVIGYNKLLNKAPDFERAEGVLERMKKEGIRPDEVTFNSLMNKAPGFECAEAVLESMKKEGVRPNEVTFNSLLKKAPDFEHAEGVLVRMKKEGIRPNEVTFTSLLNKAPDFERAEGVLERMKKEGVRPNEVRFNSLLNKVLDFEHAEGVLKRMKKEGVQPDAVTFSSLLNKSLDFEHAEGVLDRMKKEGVQPDEVTFNSLMNKAPDFERAKGVLERMKKEGVRPDEVTFSSLLNKAPDFERAEGVIELMKKEGVRPDKVTFSSLLNKAPDFERAEGVLNRIKKEGVQPDAVTFNSLLNKAPDFKHAEGVLESMKKEGVRPDEVTFNSLMNKAPDFERAEGVLERMKKEDVQPDEVTFNSLMNKAPDFECALNVLKLMRQSEVKLDMILKSTLLKISGMERNGHLEDKSERVFFKQYYKAMTDQDDSFIRLFADAMFVPQHKEQLIECLRTKNWWYWKIKADIAIVTDPQACFDFLKNAETDVPRTHLAHIHAIWVKNVVFNDLQDLFGNAIQRCEASLSIQPKGNLPYTGKLLLWLYMRGHGDIEKGSMAIRSSVVRWQFPHKLVKTFLQDGIWKELPSEPILHWRSHLQYFQLETSS